MGAGAQIAQASFTVRVAADTSSLQRGMATAQTSMSQTAQAAKETAAEMEKLGGAMTRLRDERGRFIKGGAAGLDGAAVGARTAADALGKAGAAAGQAAPQFTKVGESARQAGRGFQSAGTDYDGFTRALNASFPQLAQLQQVMEFGLVGGALFLGKAVVQTGFELGQLGAQSLALEASFDQLAMKSGTTADAMLSSLHRAAAGTVADSQLILAANRAMLLGVASNPEDMAALLETARIRGRAMGLSTQQAFSDIVTGIGRKSPLILDNLGIVGIQDAIEAYAASIGKTADTLSDAEAKGALLKAVIADTKQLMEGGSTAAKNYSDNMASLAVSWQNFREAVGKEAAPTTSALSAGLAGGIDMARMRITGEFDRDAYERQLRAAQDEIDRLRAEGHEFQARNNEIALERFTQEYGPEHYLEPAREKYDQLAEKAAAVRSEVEELRRAIAESGDPTGRLAYQVENLTAELSDLERQAGEARVKLNAASDATGEGTPKYSSAAEAIANVAKAEADASMNAWEAAAAFDRFAKGANAASPVVRTFAGEVANLADMFSYAALASAGVKMPGQDTMDTERLKYDQRQLTQKDVWEALGKQNMEAWRAGQDAGERYASGYRDQLEEEFSNFEGIMSSLLSPTSVTEQQMLEAKFGMYEDRWDEHARRLQAIIEGGDTSEWAWMGGGRKGDELKLWAMQEKQAFYDFQRPEMIDKEALKREYQAYLDRERAKQSLIAELYSEIGGTKPQAARFLGMDTPDLAAGEIATGAAAAVRQTSIVTPLADAWRDDISKNGGPLRDAGVMATQEFYIGATNEMSRGAGVIHEAFIEAIAPGVWAWIEREKKR